MSYTIAGFEKEASKLFVIGKKRGRSLL